MSPTMSSSASGRPLNSTTANGLPVALTARISSSCLPGRSSVLREAASPLISRDSPRASTTWSAPGRGGDRPRRCRWCAQPSGSVVRRLGVGELAALGVGGGAGVLLVDAVEHRDHVLVVGRGPTTGRACRARSSPAGRSRPCSCSRRAAARPRSSAAPSSGRRPCARPRPRRASASAPRSRPARNGAYGFSNRPARNLTRRMRRTASLSRLIEIAALARRAGRRSRA